MTDEKLKIIIDIYSKSMSIILVCDSSFNVLWCSDNGFSSIIGEKNFSEFFSKKQDIIDKEICLSVTVNNLYYTAKILPIMENGEVDGYLCTVDSIELIEQILKNKDYLNSFASRMSGIRKNCFEILNISTLLLEVFERNECYDSIGYLNSQASSVYRLLADAHNQSELVKYNLGSFDITRIELNSYLKEILTSFNTLLKNQRISTRFNGCDEVFIDVDIDRLSGVVLNLLINSVQNSLEEEKIIDVSISKKGDNVILSVSDKGVGIPSELIPRIFTPFVTSSEYELHPRSGLGLPIVKMFADAFSGNVYIITKQDHGTTVSISLKTVEPTIETLKLESKISEYISNKFSPLYLITSKIVNVKYF